MEEGRCGLEGISRSVSNHRGPFWQTVQRVFQHHFRIGGLPLTNLVEEVIKGQRVARVVELVQVRHYLLAILLVINHKLLETFQVNDKDVFPLCHSFILDIRPRVVVVDEVQDWFQLILVGPGLNHAIMGGLNPVVNRVSLQAEVLHNVVIIKGPRQQLGTV